MRFFNSKFFFSEPHSASALPVIWHLVTQLSGPDGEPVAEFLSYLTGETSTRLMIAAMALPPTLFVASHWNSEELSEARTRCDKAGANVR